MGTRNARLLDLAYEPILIRDAEDRITFWNNGAARLYGWTADEAIGRMSHELLQTAFPQPLEEIRRALLADRQWQGELIHTTRDGRRLTVSSRWVAYDDAEFGPLTLETNFDLTELQAQRAALEASEKRLRDLNATLEQRIADRTRDLEESNRDLEAFSYSVSHDLRAPLRAIRGFADALKEDYAGKLDAEGLTFLGQIEAGSERMAQLIDDLLSYSRLGRASLSLSPVLLRDVLTRALEQISPLHPDPEIQVPPDLAVAAHTQTLVQVIVNLLTNACKFTRNNSAARVRVCAEALGTRVRLWVEDEGIGIAPEHQDRIFQVFERLHGHETYPGTGIGLAIVRRSMERMGGEAGVESTLGQGSRFWIEMERVEAK